MFNPNLNTLLKVNLNWVVFGGLALVIRVFFPGISWYSYFALMISLHQFLLLFYSIGYVIPVRYLFGFFMCIQMLIGPTFAFNGLDDFQRAQYTMQITQEDYYTYVIPAVLCFIIGLHITANNLDGEVIDQDIISKIADERPELSYWLIGVGFICSVLSQMVSSGFAFALFLLGSLKFIGAFLIIIRKKQLHIIPLVIVFSSIILSSLAGGMFHDLLTWLIFTGSVFALRYKPSNYLKLLAVLGFIILAFTIQKLKGGYREETWGKGEEGNLETLEKVYKSKSDEGNFFSVNSFAESNLRINQGFIITHIMKTVPNRVPYANGSEMMQIIEAALLPRIFAPNKLNAGDRDLFMKYSGMPLAAGTSMGLSSVGDAYINFGIIGGSLFMFLLGLFYSEVLKAFFRYSKTYPLLILFTSLVFYYPIRPDCELQTILGHLVKACFLIFAMMQIWKPTFKLYKFKVQPNAA